jgi:hypothetical protein
MLRAGANLQSTMSLSLSPGLNVHPLTDQIASLGKCGGAKSASTGCRKLRVAVEGAQRWPMPVETPLHMRLNKLAAVIRVSLAIRVSSID